MILRFGYQHLRTFSLIFIRSWKNIKGLRYRSSTFGFMYLFIFNYFGLWNLFLKSEPQNSLWRPNEVDRFKQASPNLKKPIWGTQTDVALANSSSIIVVREKIRGLCRSWICSSNFSVMSKSTLSPSDSFVFLPLKTACQFTLHDQGFFVRLSQGLSFGFYLREE